MRIAEIEIHEFEFELPDVGTRNGNWVYDPGSTLEPPGFVLTVRTADGVEGHYRGFAFTPPQLAQIRMVCDDLVGRDPLEREGIWTDLWRGLRHTDHLGLGPIDVALWDLAGTHYGEPVSALLGGYRESVPAYASTFFADDAPDGLNSPEAFAEYAEQCRDEGYDGFKMHSFPTGDPDADVAACRALADAVGDEMDLMLDVGSLYETYSESVRVGRVLDDLGFFWYEDPLLETGQSAHLAARLSRELETSILGLEHVRTGPYGTVDHAVADAFDLARSSAHLDGGITGVMKTARAVEGFGLDVELLLGGPAHLHCMSAIRNTSYFERGLLHPEAEWMAAQGFEGSVEELDDGRVPVPDGDGIGVEIDWAFVDRRRTDHEVIG